MARGVPALSHSLCSCSYTSIRLSSAAIKIQLDMVCLLRWIPWRFSSCSWRYSGNPILFVAGPASRCQAVNTTAKVGVATGDVHPVGTGDVGQHDFKIHSTVSTVAASAPVWISASAPASRTVAATSTERISCTGVISETRIPAVPGPSGIISSAICSRSAHRSHSPCTRPLFFPAVATLRDSPCPECHFILNIKRL